jgi:hypothetical protein
MAIKASRLNNDSNPVDPGLLSSESLTPPASTSFGVMYLVTLFSRTG